MAYIVYIRYIRFTLHVYLLIYDTWYIHLAYPVIVFVFELCYSLLLFAYFQTAFEA